MPKGEMSKRGMSTDHEELLRLVEAARNRPLTDGRDRCSVVACLFCLKIRSVMLFKRDSGGWFVQGHDIERSLAPVGICPSCAESKSVKGESEAKGE